MRFRISLIPAAVGTIWFFSTSQAASRPEDDLAVAIKTFFGKSFTPDWSGIEALPGVQWAPLPPTMLQNCLPDGGCFSRQGRTTIGGRNLAVTATGARGSVTNVYLRNATAPF